MPRTITRAISAATEPRHAGAVRNLPLNVFLPRRARGPKEV